VEQVKPPGDEVTVYPVMGDPPFDAGALHDTVAEESPESPATELGAAGTEAAANRTFNVTNGDVFLWQDMFPLAAKRFGMELGAPHPMSLAVLMADKAPVWQRIAEKHQLAPWSLDQLIGGSWQFADFAFARPGQMASILSTIAIRQAGFADCIDSAEMLDWWLADLQRRRILPA
jgi:hypothetical protein